MVRVLQCSGNRTEHWGKSASCWRGTIQHAGWETVKHACGAQYSMVGAIQNSGKAIQHNGKQYRVKGSRAVQHAEGLTGHYSMLGRWTGHHAGRGGEGGQNNTAMLYCLYRSSWLL